MKLPALFREASLVIALLLGAENQAHGQTEPGVLRAVPPGEDRIEPLKQGVPSPFSGQLFDGAKS